VRSLAHRNVALTRFTLAAFDNIRVWRRLDGGEAPGLTEAELDAVRERIIETPGDQVLLTIDASGVQVIPYREL